MGEPITILDTTSDEQLDRALRGLIALLELTFPERVHSCYLQGSCADGALTPLSDLDLAVVFQGAPTESERQSWRRLKAAAKQLCSRDLDLVLLSEDALRRADLLELEEDFYPVLEAVGVKCASKLVYGADLRPDLPLPPYQTYRRTMMHLPYLVMRAQRGEPEQLRYPVDYPNPADEFYGYTGRRLRNAEGRPVPSTKRLVHIAGYIATALVANHGPHYVGNKREAARRAQELFADERAAYFAELQQLCYHAWGYRVPEDPAERALLRDLARRSLAFENSFLEIYRSFLYEELAADDERARQFAERRLRLLGEPLSRG